MRILKGLPRIVQIRNLFATFFYIIPGLTKILILITVDHSVFVEWAKKIFVAPSSHSGYVNFMNEMIIPNLIIITAIACLVELFMGVLLVSGTLVSLACIMGICFHISVLGFSFGAPYIVIPSNVISIVLQLMILFSREARGYKLK